MKDIYLVIKHLAKVVERESTHTYTFVQMEFMLESV